MEVDILLPDTKVNMAVVWVFYGLFSLVFSFHLHAFNLGIPFQC